tara:strand:+ start:137 stop:1066 length:930 start_codon:yes stop_codon:yes gene_type:complete
MNLCLVGLGNHGLGVILPSIINSKSKLIATVSSKDHEINKKYNIKNYKSLSSATRILNKNTVFVLTTPPQIHERQIINLMSKGYSIIVEKPSILNKKYYFKYIELKNHKNFVFENFMYFETKLFESFIKIFSQKNLKINELIINFCIPKFPNNSFRNELDIIDVLVFDLCCYPVSLITQLFDFKEIPNINLRVLKKNYRYSLNLKINKINIKIKFGISQNYQNNCILNTLNKKIKFNYFFYGKKKLKQISIKNKNENKFLPYKEIYDLDTFSKIFSQPKNFFFKNELNKKKAKTNFFFLNKILDLCKDS